MSTKTRNPKRTLAGRLASAAACAATLTLGGCAFDSTPINVTPTVAPVARGNLVIDSTAMSGRSSSVSLEQVTPGTTRYLGAAEAVPGDSGRIMTGSNLTGTPGRDPGVSDLTQAPGTFAQSTPGVATNVVTPGDTTEAFANAGTAGMLPASTDASAAGSTIGTATNVTTPTVGGSSLTQITAQQEQQMRLSSNVAASTVTEGRGRLIDTTSSRSRVASTPDEGRTRLTTVSPDVRSRLAATRGRSRISITGEGSRLSVQRRQ